MKKLVKDQEVEGEGLISLLEEQVLIFSVNYIYTGKLTGVNDTFIQLEGARLVYETGAFTVKDYTDAQSLPGKVWYVNINTIESFGLGK